MLPTFFMSTPRSLVKKLDELQAVLNKNVDGVVVVGV